MVTTQHGKWVSLATCQRPIGGRGGMYWDDQGIFVGKESPERMFVDWTILSKTGWEDT